MTHMCRRCGNAGILITLANFSVEVEYFKCPVCDHVWVHNCGDPDTNVTDVTQHASARTHCPDCYAPTVINLSDVLSSPRVDYFRCRSCGCLWMVPKGAEEPATRAVFGKPNASVNSKAG